MDWLDTIEILHVFMEGCFLGGEMTSPFARTNSTGSNPYPISSKLNKDLYILM